MARKADIPQFGPLAGVTVVTSGAGIAGPFAAALMADFGADVIWVESPSQPDASRYGDRYFAAQDRRNRRSLALNIRDAEGSRVFLRLMKQADIFVESSRGGTFREFGLADEVLWEANPSLVVVHLSGFGQDGVPDYVRRPSWDGIGQAFSGSMFLNGNPEPEPPMITHVYTCDYFTGYAAATMALAALHKARMTGQGDSIDVAQYEVMLRLQADNPMKYLNRGEQVRRQGNTNPTLFGYSVYRCKDGNYIFMALVGYGVLKSGLPLFGCEFGSDDFPATLSHVPQGSPGARKLEPRIQEFFASRTVAEAEVDLVNAGIPCSPVMDYAMMVDHPHYQARGVFTEWDNPVGLRFRGVSVLPKLQKHPGRIWRGYPTLGMDNEDILAELGYSPADIAALYERKALGKKDDL